MRKLSGIGLFVLISIPLFAQSSTAPPAFNIADVHSSARSTNPFFQGGVLRGERYVAKNATMVDLIATAYGVDNEKVVSGPSWLDTDRFDIIAKAPSTSTPETVKQMLQTLLADRFNLVVHNDTKPMSSFALGVGKGKPKLKESDGSGNSGCQPQPQQNAPPGSILVTCHNVTMESFAQIIHQFAGGYLTSPVVDSTGLKGSWDFDIKWTARGQLAQAGPDGISIFDAVDKQLGLKLDLQKIALPVLMVDRVNEKPTDNPPGVTATLPTPPPAEFEVAVIKPSAPNEPPGGRIIPSGQVDVQSITLKTLIIIAWNLNPNDNDALVGAPKWLDSDKFDITAKAPATSATTNNGIPFDIDDLRVMLQKLLIERFKMVVHMEDRPVNAYTLVAANPKMKKADPLNRTGCKNGPGPDGKDPRIANPILARLVSCQNITMAQFADQLPNLAGGYIFNPVLDGTGLEGAWDFTLSFSTANVFQGGAGAGGRGGNAAPSTGDASTASDPSGALSIFDAISKQLGLKLEKQKRPLPVLVIDHVEEKPTDN